jgi:hypothetical protein
MNIRLKLQKWIEVENKKDGKSHTPHKNEYLNRCEKCEDRLDCMNRSDPQYLCSKNNIVNFDCNSTFFDCISPDPNGMSKSPPEVQSFSPLSPHSLTHSSSSSPLLTSPSEGCVSPRIKFPHHSSLTHFSVDYVPSDLSYGGEGMHMLSKF